MNKKHELYWGLSHAPEGDPDCGKVLIVSRQDLSTGKKVSAAILLNGYGEGHEPKLVPLREGECWSDVRHEYMW